mgnify:CR=1 FL=1
MDKKGKATEITFNLKDTSMLLRIFDATTLSGSEFRNAVDTMRKVEDLHTYLTENSVTVKGRL